MREFRSLLTLPMGLDASHRVKDRGTHLTHDRERPGLVRSRVRSGCASARPPVIRANPWLAADARRMRGEDRL